jgi:hypothetical protein
MGPRVDVTDVNGDGLLDLVTRFETQLTGFQQGDTRGILKGRTTTGQSFAGWDSIQTNGPGSPWGRSEGSAAASDIGSNRSTGQEAESVSPVAAFDLLFSVEATGDDETQAENERLSTDSAWAADLGLLAAARATPDDSALNSAIVDHLFADLGEDESDSPGEP